MVSLPFVFFSLLWLCGGLIQLVLCCTKPITLSLMGVNNWKLGTIAGAITGQTTKADFLDGAGKGAVTGAITDIELVTFATVREPLSEVTIVSNLLNGKIFMEWIRPRRWNNS